VADLRTRVRFPPPPPNKKGHPCGGPCCLVATGIEGSHKILSGNLELVLPLGFLDLTRLFPGPNGLLI
jgi:hypothetical protein